MRGVPRRQRAGGALVRAQAVGVTDLRRDVRAAPTSSRCRSIPAISVPVGVRPGEDVVLDRARRAGPLAVDSLPALVDEDRGVARRACSSVTLLATSTRLALYQGPAADPVAASVGRLPLPASRSTLRYARQVRSP